MWKIWGEKKKGISWMIFGVIFVCLTVFFLNSVLLCPLEIQVWPDII